jgi:hypothetical protein
MLYDLLIECCRYTPDVTQLEKYAKRIDDWDGFLESAYVHGVFPLVHKSLKLVSAVPENIKLRLKSINLEIARRNMTMTAELLKIMKLLEDNGISALAIKGPVLSQMIHADITKRQYADLDILVNENDLLRTAEILHENGYSLEQPLKFLKNKTILKILKDFMVTKPIQNISIEIHWRLFLESQIKKKSFINDPHEFSDKVLINDTLIRTLDKTKLFLYLVLHGSKHLWERLEWIVDIDRIVRSIDIDFDDILGTLQSKESGQLFNLGILICYELFKTPFPDNILRNAQTMLSIKNANNIILDGIFNNLILDSDPVLHDEMNYLFFDNTNQAQIVSKGILLYRALTRLDPADLYLIDLPVYLAFIYRVIHLFNVINRLISNK